jgi:alginate O-acetyltransferase complex protein AlgI
LLLYFKYANFFCDNTNLILSALSVQPISWTPIALPLGVSFFTFHGISYLIDIYRRDARAQSSFTCCALYLALFPQLIAGPIIRYHDIAEQLLHRCVTLEQFSSGIQRFIFGLAKKVLLANPLGAIVDAIFRLPAEELAMSCAWLGIVCYSLQIYFDFSGYSDMAIGLARMFGFEFRENFNYPYISQSVREFWRRWHISLSTWFRDYLYIPLGGNRASMWRTYVNLWVVFLLCGLWHGASWNFVVWGCLHGMYLVNERLGFEKVIARLWRPLRHAYTLALVLIGWVFFRADSPTTACHYLASMFGVIHVPDAYTSALDYLDHEKILTLAIAVIFATPLSQLITRTLTDLERRRPHFAIRGGIASLHFGLLAMLFLLSASHLAAGTYNPFIYFRF